MTLDRRAALVQLASMLKSAHGQLTHIYRAEQEQTEAQAAAIEAGDRAATYSSAGRSMNWPPRCNSLHGCVENMESAIEYGRTK